MNTIQTAIKRIEAILADDDAHITSKVGDELTNIEALLHPIGIEYDALNKVADNAEAVHQALKDIINAAGNNEPYKPAEIEKLFIGISDKFYSSWEVLASLRRAKGGEVYECADCGRVFDDGDARDKHFMSSDCPKNAPVGHRLETPVEEAVRRMEALLDSEDAKISSETGDELTEIMSLLNGETSIQKAIRHLGNDDTALPSIEERVSAELRALGIIAYADGGGAGAPFICVPLEDGSFWHFGTANENWGGNLTNDHAEDFGGYESTIPSDDEDAKGIAADIASHLRMEVTAPFSQEGCTQV